MKFSLPLLRRSVARADLADVAIRAGDLLWPVLPGGVITRAGFNLAKYLPDALEALGREWHTAIEAEARANRIAADSADYRRAAAELDVDPLLVRAMAWQESREAGFTDAGVIIRFEPHIFRKRTAEFFRSLDAEDSAAHRNFRAERSDEKLSALNQVRQDRWRYVKLYEAYSTSGYRFNARQATQHQMLADAKLLNLSAAAQSFSYGWPQIMGFNSEICGYDSPVNFMVDMQSSVERQTQAYIRFCIHPLNRGLLKAMRGLDYDGVAYFYNGPKGPERGYGRDIAGHVARFHAEGLGA
ncbi:N-acetylmuramidase domain-containing protein [Hyphomonas sp.]|uniref:N-acetylmuramidase domain-containing protein n=1 Tax=Hyphomonas sp. TaxID=87 RepID=UPI0032EF73DF